MSTIHVWNKGKRTWDLIGADGQKHRVSPQESLEMDEAKGYKLIADYRKDWTASRMGGPSSEDLKRREQSLRDRETALKAREDSSDYIKRPISIAEAVEIIAPFLSSEGAAYLAETNSAWKGGEKMEVVQSPTGPNGTTMADSPLDKDALISEAKALGLKVDGRMGAEKIKAIIDEAKAAK